MGLIDTILNLPKPLVADWGYIILFLMATLEATPVFGFLAAGQVIVAAAGFFVKMGVLDLTTVLIISILGAILGDYLSYVIGKRYGDARIRNFISDYGKYFLVKEGYYEKTNEVMRDHTGKWLIIGRFNSVTRAFAAFVAGTSKVDIAKFMFYNVTGGILWGATYTMLGYLFGESYEIISGYLTDASLIIIAALILGYLAYRKYRELQEESFKEEKERK